MEAWFLAHPEIVYFIGTPLSLGILAMIWIKIEIVD
jgi:hypothetical protein